jgi:hypothetical protein
MSETSWVLSVIAGVAVAAACGLRAFLPLLGLGIAGRLGWFELDPRMEWLAGDPALWALGCATVVEIAADKIPIVDHALDVVATLLRPAAAALGGYAMLDVLPTPWAQIAGLGFGGIALAVHALKAKIRLGSTAVTMGQANPALSTGEDVVSLGTLASALLAPVLAILVVVLLIAGLTVWLVLRRRPAVAAGSSPH